MTTGAGSGARQAGAAVVEIDLAVGVCSSAEAVTRRAYHTGSLLGAQMNRMRSGGDGRTRCGVSGAGIMARAARSAAGLRPFRRRIRRFGGRR